MGRGSRAKHARRGIRQSLPAEVAKEQRLRLQDGPAMVAAFGGSSHSGKAVTLTSTMQLPTAWACIRLTAQAVSSLPLAMFERLGDNDRRKVGSDEGIAEVICESPNADQTPQEFWEGQVAWMMTDGNAYSVRETYGNHLSSLQPVASTHCSPFRTNDGELKYRITDRGKVEVMPREKIFHLKGFGFGGDVGLSPIRFGVQTFGSAIAREEAIAKVFASGMQASGVLSTDKTLKGNQREDLQEVMGKYAGSSNAGKLMILEAGLKYERLTLSPVDVQLLEQHRFGVEEICRWFGIPPIIIGHAAQGQTMWGSGVEQLLIAWLTLGINPLCDRIEQRIKKQLIRPSGKRNQYAEFNREALIQMDSGAKAAFLSSMTQNGLMTRNEGRSKLNMDRRDGGDSLTVQSNLVPLEQLGTSGGDASARNAMRTWLGMDDNERQTGNDS